MGPARTSLKSWGQSLSLLGRGNYRTRRKVCDVRLLQLCTTQADVEDRVVYVIDLFKCKDIDGLKALIESRNDSTQPELISSSYFNSIDFKHKIFDTFIRNCLVAGSKEKKVSPKLRRFFSGKPVVPQGSC